MANVDLYGVYLAPVSDLSQLLILNAGVSVSSGSAVRGEFRPYSAGRVRLVSKAGRSTQVQVAARRVDRATRELLDSWTGVLLLLRDGRGRKVYGSYLLPAFAEQPGLPFCDVSFTLTEVSHSEAV